MAAQQAFIGLRSGGVLIVTKGEGGTPEVDASQVRLSDVAYGLVGQNRFANQLHRQPYTVLEHSVLGSYLFDDPALATAYLWHDTAEGFGICDLNWRIKLMYGTQIKRVENAILEALARRFDFTYPLPPQIKQIDRALGAYELVALHPAAYSVAKGYGFDLEDARTRLLSAHRGIIDRWFARPPLDLARQVQMWTDRLQVLQVAARDLKAVAGVEYLLRRPGFLPYSRALLVPRVAQQLDFGVPQDMVRAEVDRLVDSGVLVLRDHFYHLAETAAEVPG